MAKNRVALSPGKKGEGTTGKALVIVGGSVGGSGVTVT
jgi:hypothetical protein